MQAAAFLRLLLVSCLVWAWPAPAFSQVGHAEARAAWGFDRSDIQPHPAVRFGVLRSGMRYALMRSETPAGGLSVRLHIAAGATVERAREQGFMHLVEHMIFHGSANIPEGSLPLMLRQAGLARWTDFNAYTSYDETVYRLELARADARARATSLMLMREIASELRFTRNGVAGAKKMVTAEIAGRDAVQDRIMSAQNAFFMAGTPLDRGPVAGTTADVKRATPEALERLYRTHYVPSRTTLVIVGDIDPSVAQREIEQAFSTWQAAASTRPEGAAQVGAPQRRGASRAFIDAAAPTMVTIASVRPVRNGAETEGERGGFYLQHLASELLGRRLAKAARMKGAAFREANAASYKHFSTALLTRIEVTPFERDWRRALVGAAEVLRTALATGFSKAELDEQVALGRQALAAARPAQSSAELADAIVDAVGRGIIYSAAAERSASEAYLSGLQLADVNAAFRSAWGGSEPLVFVSHNRRVDDLAQAVTISWQGSAVNAGATD